jgi:undecaprenyl-diphosphatase
MAEEKSWLAVQVSRWLLLGLATNIAAVIFFAWLAGEVLKGETLLIDEDVRQWLYRLASPALTRVMQTITILGSGLFLLILGALIGIAFVLAKWWRALLLLFVAMGGAVLLNFSLKASFRRARPSSFFDTPLPSSFSFPSGHALLSLCFYCSITYLVASRMKNPYLRCAVWLSVSVAIFAIGVSRIYLGVHYPSDVIAGYVAGAFWLVTVILVDRSFYARKLRAEGANRINLEP